MFDTVEEIEDKIKAIEYASGMAETAWYTTGRREAEANPTTYGDKLKEHQDHITTLATMKLELLKELKFKTR